MEPNIGAVETSGHKWHEIKDLPENWCDLCRDDLRAVHQQWSEDRAILKDETKVKEFQEELALQWAIETGIIERLYKLERGVTVQIAQAGLAALGRFHAQGKITTDIRNLITDQREALEMVMDIVGGRRDLSSFYIKELHQLLTRSQKFCQAEDSSGKRIEVKLQKGNWKKLPNNPRRPDGSFHQYCPPERVQDQIDQLLKWHQEHQKHPDTCTEVEAAWLHHRFTQIHPFQDGNGRVARALTGAVFLKAEYLVLVIRDAEHRELYLKALEAADADSDNLKPLVDLFADIQIEDLNTAIESLRQLRGEPIIGVAESLAERVRRRKNVSQEQTADVMNRLIQVAMTQLDAAKNELEHAFRKKEVTIEAEIKYDNDDKTNKYYWWSWQIIDAAKTYRYFADLKRPRRWVSLSLSIPEIEPKWEKSHFVLSLHAVGRAADLHAATMFLTSPLDQLDYGEGADSRRWQNDVVSEHPFLFAAETGSPEKIEKRFLDWLETNIQIGLDKWGERL